MKGTSILLIILIVLLILVFPLAFSIKSSSGYFGFFTLLGSLSAFGTLIIAFLLYDKYGLKKSHRNNQLILIKNLIVELKEISFFISNPQQIGFLRPGQKTKNKIVLEFSSDRILYFSFDFFPFLANFIKRHDNIDLPVEIARMIKNLSYNSFSPISSNDLGENYFILQVINIVTIKDIQIHKFNEEEKTVKEFFDAWEQLYDELIHFLEIHDPNYNTLNL